MIIPIQYLFFCSRLRNRSEKMKNVYCLTECEEVYLSQRISICSGSARVYLLTTQEGRGRLSTRVSICKNNHFKVIP